MRNRRWVVSTLALLVVLVGVAGVAGAWATSYDRRTSNQLLPGTRIQGIDVGSMEAGAAVRLLQEEIEAPLHQPLELRAGNTKVTTTPWDLGLRVDVRAAVRRAQGEADGSPLVRVWRRLFTSPDRSVAAAPRWHDDVFDSAVADLAAKVKVDPVDASVDGSGGWLNVKPGKSGLALDTASVREAVTDGMLLEDPVVDLPTIELSPAVTKDSFFQVILIRTGENKLYLYKNGAIAKEWPVATGAAGYATPVGTWQITQKIKNPSWHNPGSAWARGMPAVIPPGPNNPLGTHALRLNAPAILIHATPDRASIGYNASHGCIRMLTEHEIELFDQVEVGTPVVVVDAGTPQPRTSTVTTTDPALAAASQF